MKIIHRRIAVYDSSKPGGLRSGLSKLKVRRDHDFAQGDSHWQNESSSTSRRRASDCHPASKIMISLCGQYSTAVIGGFASWPLRRSARSAGSLLKLALFIGILTGLAWLNSGPAQAAGEEFPPICTDVTAISPEECGALVTLYEATGGADWSDNTNWLQIGDGITPCDWHGVGCQDGHVRSLNLAQNGLVGRLPSTVGQLGFLESLDLAGNRLGPRLAAGICDLGDTVESADFGYNLLEVRAAATRACLDALDPDWRETQTISPFNLELTGFGPGSIELTWSPILYNDDGGFYEISYSTSFSGDYVVHGTVADRSLTGYTLDGLEPGTSYFVRVRSVTPAHANHPETVSSDPTWAIGVTAGEGRILLAVHISADNNLSSYVPSILRRIRRGTDINPNLTALVLADRRGENNTQLFRSQDGEMTAVEILEDVWGGTELDMADPAVLTWFLRYARESVQPDRMIVSLVGHGVGPTPDLAWVPETPPEEPPASPVDGIPPLPRGLEFTPADVTDGSYLSTPDLARALIDATDNGADPFDILFFDQCFQGNLDVLYEVRNVAEHFVASPNYAWLVAPYAQYISQMAPAADNAAIAEAIINRYQANLNNRHPNAIFWASSGDIEQIATAVSGLGAALLAALDDGQVDAIRRASFNSAFVDTTQCGRGEFVLGPPDELVGAGSFALNLRRGFGENDAYGVFDAASQVLTALGNLKSSSRSGSPYIAPDEVWEYNDRITILAPLARNLAADIVWRASIYQAADEQTAVWTPDPAQTVLVQGTYAFVKDHGWDEFINAWYGELTPTVGNWCHYTPPSIVLDEDAEALPMTAELSGSNGVTLTWDEPTEADPSAYHLYGRLPLGIDLELLDVIPSGAEALAGSGYAAAEAVSVTLENLFPGEYTFLLVAVDEDDRPLAQSGEIGVAVEWAGEIFLPVIAR